MKKTQGILEMKLEARDLEITSLKKLNPFEKMKKEMQMDFMKERNMLETKLQEYLHLSKQSILSRTVSLQEVGYMIGEISVKLKEIEDDLNSLSTPAKQNTTNK